MNCRERGAIFIDYIVAGALGEVLLTEARFQEFIDADGATLLPMDFAPIRHRDTIPALMTFLDRQDPGCADFDNGHYYLVKGDGDQDRAN